MNYSEILQSLQQASSFDLYRLQVAISRHLESPERIQKIREQLSVGQEIEIFNEDDNKSEIARILKFNPTSIGVIFVESQSRWRIPYYWVNLEGSNVSLRNTAKKGIEKNALSVDETVGFRSREGQEVYGKIIRLNPKTVTLKTGRGEWRVSYSLLFPVIDSSIIHTEYIAHNTEEN